MIRRKDSMAYAEFMRGKYNPGDTAYVRRLLENMTVPELNGLKHTPFETLWGKLWLHADKHEHEYQAAADKCAAVARLIAAAKSPYPEPEWGFPKGRRYRCETDQQCAEREFFEETNIPRDGYILVKDVVFTETFLGTNGIPYEHRYFLALPRRMIEISPRLTVTQKREISAIGWMTLEQCRAHTRPHYTERLSMLDQLGSFVASVEVPIPNVLQE